MTGRSPLKTLRAIAVYAALATGVTVGGVVIGAIVVAPAVSRTRPIAQPAPAPAEALAAAKAHAPSEAVLPGAPEGLRALRVRGATTLQHALDVVRRVPKIIWVYVDIGLVLALVAAWSWRRRSAPGITTRRAATLPIKLMSEKSDRTPRAVLALAEAGASPSDIARRTGLSVDAVAMCLSIGA